MTERQLLSFYFNYLGIFKYHWSNGRSPTWFVPTWRNVSMCQLESKFLKSNCSAIIVDGQFIFVQLKNYFLCVIYHLILALFIHTLNTEVPGGI